MSELIVRVRAGDDWKTIGRLRPGDPPATMSHNAPTGREIIQFSCREDHALIERSRGGIDSELHGGAVRAVTSIGYDLLARLEAGQQYEMRIRTDRMTAPALVRFCQVDS